MKAKKNHDISMAIGFVLLSFTLFPASLLAQQSSSPLMGFSPKGATKQQQLEKQFDSYLQANDLDKWMQRLAARPHHVGSPYGKENAEFIASKFRQWGYETKIESFQVLFPTPKLRVLEMVKPTTYKAGLTELPLKEDPASQQTDEQLPPYNCYSIDGDVTAELVFVNYGVPADYEELEKLGIDVKGKIVIAKYMGSWRGIKPKVAAEKGAIGCIIYSDPKDDGYYQGDVYPKGAFKNEYGVQRGAVMDMPLYPGDPLTPGYGATDDAKRLDIKDSPSLTKIPVLPISHHDALPLLKALEGPVAPAKWRGALPITYHVGPGPAKVHLKLEFNWDLQPAYDIIAKMKGSAYPDEWVIRGNHHDAWVNGANDPISGQVAMLEEAKAVSTLAKTGWKPKRTLVYCAWGGEEPGLLGSTEWAETHAKELRQKAVVYINSDGNGRGFLRTGGSHTLEKFFDQVTRSVQDPQREMSVFERRKDLDMVRGKPELKYFKLSALGSGSDYSPFLQHLGIAALNIGFGGESSGGEYHTIYDTYDLYTRFKDPGFHYGIALAEVAGHSSLRLADAEVLPFEFQHFSRTVASYSEEVIKLADDLRSKTEKENRMIREGIYEAAADPTKSFVVPKPKAEVPFFNFAPLQNAVNQLKKQAAAFEKALQTADLSPEKSEKLNQLFKDMERALTLNQGLPRRPWFTHQIYAPGFYTGYGVKTLPGVREALEQRNFVEAQDQIYILGKVLEGYNERIDEAIKLLQ